MNRFQTIVLTLLFISSDLVAAKPATKPKMEAKPIGIYFGGFSGWGYCSSDLEQKATAFLSDASGGPLSVNAKGDSKTSHFWFGGVHIGYEFLQRTTKSRAWIPAAELEGYYFANTLKANVENNSNRLDLHLFSDSFPMRTGLALLNGSLALSNDYITPYLGIGIGAAMISVHGANSTQTDPAEPGINHFNSDPNDFNWSFAVQAKGGLSHTFMVKPSFGLRLFSDSRFVYLPSTTFTFGSTQYPGHAATTNWDATFSKRYYNLFSLGLDFLF